MRLSMDEEQLSQEENLPSPYSNSSLAAVVTGLLCHERARGKVDGWKEAAARLRDMAGIQYAAGLDNQAQATRSIARDLDKIIKEELDRPRSYESAHDEDLLWGEIESREGEEDVGTDQTE